MEQRRYSSEAKERLQVVSNRVEFVDLLLT